MRLKIDQNYIIKAKCIDFLTEINEHGHKQPQHIQFINIKCKPFSKFDFNPMYMVFQLRLMAAILEMPKKVPR